MCCMGIIKVNIKNIIHFTMKRNLLFVGGLIALMSTISSCVDTPIPPRPTDVLPLSQQVLEYYQSTNSEEQDFTEGYSAYFDFSDGMEFAYKNTDTRANLKSITHTVAGNVNDWKVYSLAADKVTELNLSQTELFNKVIATKYKDMKAPIEGAIQQIVKDRKRALLITDFEEYDYDSQIKKDVIEQQAFATPYFQEWLRTGGVIKFYITDYKENKLNKKLFFIVFDSDDLELTNVIEKTIEGNNKIFREFLLSNTPCKVFTEYTPGRGGCYHDDSGSDIVTAVLETGSEPKYEKFAGMNVEFYPMGEAWSNVPVNVKSVKETPNSNYLGILSHLYIDLSEKDSYDIKNLKAKVYDVTDDLFSYSDNRAALRNTPDVSTDELGNPIVCFTTHPDAQFYYDATTGKLLSEYEYTKLATPAVEHLLKVNEDVFRQSYSEDPSKTHIVIDLDDAYLNATFVQNPNTFMYELADDVLANKIAELNHRTLRVDVCLGDSDYDINKLSELFSFESNLYYMNGKNLQKKLGVNECLYQSIRQVFQKDDLKPQDKVIYTYYMMD